MSRNRNVIYLILHDIRSVHNVGAIFRTAEGAGVSRIILSGKLEDAIIAHFAEVGDLRRNVGRNPKFAEIGNWAAAEFTIKHEGDRREGIR